MTRVRSLSSLSTEVRSALRMRPFLRAPLARTSPPPPGSMRSRMRSKITSGLRLTSASTVMRGIWASSPGAAASITESPTAVVVGVRAVVRLAGSGGATWLPWSTALVARSAWRWAAWRLECEAASGHVRQEQSVP